MRINPIFVILKGNINNLQILIMKKIRIGNDIKIFVSIFRDGEPLNLTGKTVTISLGANHRTIPIEEFEMERPVGVVSFTYRAASQMWTGLYSLTVQVINAGAVNTADKFDAFELVASSKDIGGTDEPNIVTEVLNYALDMALDSGVFVPGTTDYNDLSNKPSLGGVVLQGDLSVTDIPGLKGDKGDKGEPGIQGPKGEKGDTGATPAKGVDYFTNTDLTDMQTAVVNGLTTRALSITYDDDTTETINFLSK